MDTQGSSYHGLTVSFAAATASSHAAIVGGRLSLKDDYEVSLRAIHHRCGFVIRAARLNRQVQTLAGRRLSLADLLESLPAHGERDITVKATTKQPVRTARVTLTFGELVLPVPEVVTHWIKEHPPERPLILRVVELREASPPKGCQAVRRVRYTT